MSPRDSSGPPDRSRRRPAPAPARDLRRRRRNAFVIVLVALLAVVGAIAWSARDSGGSGDSGATADAATLRVFATPPKQQLPAPATTQIAVTAAGGSGLQMRLVAAPKGAAHVPAPWQAAAKALPVPANVARATAGLIPGFVEVREDSGGTARSGVFLLPPGPGPGTAQVVRSGSSAKPYVALVSDDGIDCAGVSRIIDVLRRTRSGGTFCLNGINVRTWSGSPTKKVEAAVADGLITLCSHGRGHRTSTTTSEAEAMADLSTNASADRQLGVSSVPFYRPAYGALSPGSEKAAGKLGYRWIVLWGVDPSDYEKPDVATLTGRVVSASTRGSIVVLHAIGTTADALPSMICGLKAKGHKAVTLTTMFGDPAATPGDGAGSTSTTPVATGGDAPPAPGERA